MNTHFPDERCLTLEKLSYPTKDILCVPGTASHGKQNTQASLPALRIKKSWKHLSSPLLFLGTGYSVPCIISGGWEVFLKEMQFAWIWKASLPSSQFQIDFQGWRACEPEKPRQHGNISVLFFSHKEFIAVSKAKIQPSKINTQHLAKLRTLVSSFPFPSKPKFWGIFTSSNHRHVLGVQWTCNAHTQDSVYTLEYVGIAFLKKRNCHSIQAWGKFLCCLQLCTCVSSSL